MTAIETMLQEPAIQALGWALLHFVWQGTVLAALAAVTFRALRHSAADIRYVVGVVTLSLMATLPVVTGVQVYASLRAEAAAAGSPAAPPLPVATGTPAASAEGGVVASGAAAAVTPIEVERFEAWLPSLVLAWMAGVALLALRLLGGWLWLQRVKTRGAVPADHALQAIVRRLTRTLHIARPVALLQAPGVTVPTVIGWLKPTVLLPMSALSGLSPLQIEAILAHELAHVRRHDYLVNLLQSLLETLLFYHPAVWWVSRRIRLEREHCCDDLAVSLCGDPVVYARALADLEELRGADAGLAMAANGGVLLQRVRRLLTTPATHAGRGPAWLAASAAVLVMAGMVLGAAGQSPVIEPEPDAITQDIPLPPPPPPQAPDAPRPPAPPADEHTAATVAALPAIPAPPAVPTPPAPPAQTTIDGTHQESRGNFTWSHNGDKIVVNYSGAFELNDTDTDIVKISPGGSVKFSDGVWLRGHSVEFSADASGNISRRFFIGRTERPYEPEGREWLAQTLPRFVRMSGFGAKARVARILRQGGVPAVLAEISRIESSHGRSVYFTELVKTARIDAATALRVLDQAGRELTSDYELATFLTQGAGTLLADDAAAQAYLKASRSLGSDYEMRRVFTAMLKRGRLNAPVLAAMLDTAKELGSDYETASLLLDVVRDYPVEGQVRQPFFALLATVDSSYETGRVLQAILRRRDVSADTLLTVLKEAGAMSGHYESSQVLLAAVRSHDITGPARDAYVAAADRLGSYEQGQVLSALVRAEKR